MRTLLFTVEPFSSSIIFFSLFPLRDFFISGIVANHLNKDSVCESTLNLDTNTLAHALRKLSVTWTNRKSESHYCLTDWHKANVSLSSDTKNTPETPHQTHYRQKYWKTYPGFAHIDCYSRQETAFEFIYFQNLNTLSILRDILEFRFLLREMRCVSDFRQKSSCFRLWIVCWPECTGRAADIQFNPIPYKHRILYYVYLFEHFQMHHSNFTIML